MSVSAPGALLRVNDAAFTVRRLLGRGKGGYCYLVCDKAGAPFVLKQIHHEPCDYYQFGDKLSSELRDYARLTQCGIPMPALLDTDHDRERLLKQYIPGETIYERILHGTMRAEYQEQLLEMCRRLYPRGLNIDYFPTNFIPYSGTLYYVDYECNEYMEQWDFQHWGVQYWSKTDALLAYAAEHP